MYKIPNSQTKRFSQTNKSDVGGNIFYTKNVNFDEEGYIKLSSRAVSIQSEKDDSDFDIPLSYGRTGNGSFLIVNADTPWITSIETTGISSTQDTDIGVQTGNTNSWGRWWQNRWHQTTNTGLNYKVGSTWTSTGVSLTSGVAHPIEIFSNRDTICIGNGNVVKQLNTSYAASTLIQLTLPTDYEVVAMAYSSSKMAVATKLSSTASNQNQEAQLFVWDGSQSTQGYPCGSDQILGLVTYKSSYVVLTRNGRLLYFNGGGFDELARFPFYNLGYTFGDSTNRSNLGDTMQVDGDVIYINMPNILNTFGDRDEVFIENNPAGIWCFDPQVGLYHRYSPSTSKIVSASVSNTGVNTTTNVLTANSAVVPETGNPVMQVYNTSDLIGGVKINTIYYVTKVTSTEFKLALTKEDAMNAVNIDLTSQASGTSYFVFLNQVDYGVSLCQNRTGGIGTFAKGTAMYDHLAFGGEYEDNTTTGIYAHSCYTVPKFENIGYFVTPKLQSQNIEDNVTKVYVKYRPLYDTDSIILKYKNKDVLGLPVTTPQVPNIYICTWTSSTTFTTSADLTYAKTFFDSSGELECEIINGAGSGSIEKITNLELSGNTYTVTLENEVVGASNGNYCNVLINNWTTLGTVTSNDSLGYKELPVSSNSKQIMVKCILKGNNITVEELQVINDTHLASK